MGEASEWIWAGVGSGQDDLCQVLPFLPDPFLRLYSLSQGLLPTRQSWDPVLDQKYRRQSLLGPATVSANLAS